MEDSLPDFLEYRPKPQAGPGFGSSAPIAATASSARLRPRSELEEALRRAGVKRGAEVELEGETLEWQ